MTTSDRSRLDRSFKKCPCGNVAGLGQTMCSRCRELAERRAEAAETMDNMRGLRDRLRYESTDAALHEAVLALLDLVIDRRS